jgi:hypothetical protein
MNCPVISLSPLRFGRRRSFVLASALPQLAPLSPDLRMFAVTYAAGFFLISLFIA